MNRREFISVVGAAAVTPAVHVTDSASAAASADDIYRRAYVTDAQCFAAAPPRTYVPYLTPDKIDALRTSGITALAMCMSEAWDPSIASESDYRAAKDVIDKWDRFVAAHDDVFMKVTNGATLEQAKRSRKVGFIYNFQNVTPLGWDLDKLTEFADLGVRQIQLSHDRRNYVADSCRELTNAGLSRFGFQVVNALNDHRVMIDLSHVGERSALDAILHSKAPVIFSHSGCYSLCPHPRNVPDRNLRTMADRGGTFCVYNQSAWLTKDPVISMDHYIAHVQHVINVAGEDHVSMGTDGDAVDMTAMRPDEVERHQRSFDNSLDDFPQLTWKVRHMRVPDLSHPQRLLHLARALDKKGFKEQAIEKILGGNYVRVFREVAG